MAIRIERRFRRSMNQELKERKQLKLMDFIIIAGIAAVVVEVVVWPEMRYFFKLIIFGGCAALCYFVVALAFAQLRAKAQPFDHTVTFLEESISVKDNLRRRTREYSWDEVQRIRISTEVFEFRCKDSDRGEVYMLNRAKLSKEEDTFLGERFVEL